MSADDSHSLAALLYGIQASLGFVDAASERLFEEDEECVKHVHEVAHPAGLCVPHLDFEGEKPALARADRDVRLQDCLDELCDPATRAKCKEQFHTVPLRGAYMAGPASAALRRSRSAGGLTSGGIEARSAVDLPGLRPLKALEPPPGGLAKVNFSRSPGKAELLRPSMRRGPEPGRLKPLRSLHLARSVSAAQLQVR